MAEDDLPVGHKGRVNEEAGLEDTRENTFGASGTVPIPMNDSMEERKVEQEIEASRDEMAGQLPG